MVPGLITPGQRITQGARIPPSQVANPRAGFQVYTIEHWLRDCSKSALWEDWIAAKLAVREYEPPVKNSEQINLLEIVRDGKSRIELMREDMKSKNVSPWALYLAIENPSPGFTGGMLATWFRGRVTIARSDYLLEAETALQSYDSSKRYDKRVFLADQFMPNGQKTVDWLRAEAKKRKIGGGRLFQSIENPPKGLTPNIFIGFINNGPETVRKDYLDLAVKAMEAIIAGNKNKNNCVHLPDGCVDLTTPYTPAGQNRIEWLQEEMRQKNILVSALHSRLRYTKTFTKAKLKTLLSGKRTYVKQAWWDDLERAVQLPERQSKQKILRSPKLQNISVPQAEYIDLRARFASASELSCQEWLVQQMEEKNISPLDVMREVRIPYFSFYKFKKWYWGENTTARRIYWDAVQKFVSDHPSPE